MNSIKSKSYLSRLFNALPKDKKFKLIKLFFLSLFSAVLQTANITLLAPYINSINGNGLVVVDRLNSISNLNIDVAFFPYITSFLYLSLCIFSAFARIKINNFAHHLSADIACYLSSKTLLNVINLPYKWHITNNSSNILSVLTDNMNQTMDAIRSVTTFIPNSILIVFVTGSIIYLEPMLMIFVCAIIVAFYFITFSLLKSKIKLLGLKRKTYFNDALSVIQSSLRNIKEIKLDDNMHYFLEMHENSTYGYRHSVASTKIIQESPKLAIEPLLISTIILIVIFYLLNDYSLDSLLEPFAILALGFSKLFTPIQQTYQVFNSIQANRAAAIAVLMYLEGDHYLYNHFKPSDNSPQSLLNNRSIIKADRPTYNSETTFLKVDKVSFRYDDRRGEVLRNVNISIQRGDIVALVGESGSGKSTLIDLLMGLIQPSSGCILHNGIDINDSNYSCKWRKLFSYVPQDLNFFDDTLERNIAYYRDSSIDSKKIEEVLDLVNMKSFVEDQLGGLNTSIGEDGIKLSGGQKQRLCIARALYKSSNIIFLDEATSALDNNTEKNIMENIINTGATIILIAHRLSTTKDCSKIILFDNGKVADVGTYSELLRSSQRFQKLARQEVF